MTDKDTTESVTDATLLPATSGSSSETAQNSTTNPHRLAFLRSASVPTLDKTAPRLVPRWVFAQGKTWVPFGIADSTRLEESHQKVQATHDSTQDDTKPSNSDDAKSTSPPALPEPDATQPLPDWRVPVGEDHMLEVDLRPSTFPPKLHSVFWKSPPVDVRRGEWFFESSRLAPCEVELSRELSLLYARIQPWTAAYAEELKASASIGSEGEEKLKCPLNSLKGSYVIFSGSHLARIYNEGVSQRLAKTLLTAWSGEHGGGTLVVRGYDQVQKLLKARKGDSSKKAKKQNQPATSTPKAAAASDLARPPTTASSSATSSPSLSSTRQEPPEPPLPAGAAEPQSVDANEETIKGQEKAMAASQTADAAKPETTAPDASTTSQPSGDLWTSFTNRLSSWGSSVPLSDKTQRDITDSFREAQQRVSESIPEKTSEFSAREARATTVIEQGEYEDDEEEEWARDREAQDEEVELVICWHGIGQKLAEEWKALEFSLAVNSLRDLVRKKSKASPPSSIGGEGFPGLTRGKRLAFLPINWRATLNDFQPTKEQEEDVNEEEHLDNQVSLDDIFGRSESIPLARSITKNLLLDIPLFLSHHRGEVLKRCIQETNRAYSLFLQRNPDFRKRGGKVSMICHSLGCVLAADVLSSQPTHVENVQDMPLEDVVRSPHLAYNTRSLYLCGSPSALFFYLQSRQLIARRGRESSLQEARPDDALDRKVWGCLSVDRVWNVYNSTDPISTCLNGCVDTRLARKVEPMGMDRVVSAILGTLPGAHPPPQQGLSEAEGSKAGSSGTQGHAGQKNNESSSSLGLFGTWGRGTPPPSSTSQENLAEPLPDLDDSGGALDGASNSGKEKRKGNKRDSWSTRIALAKKKAADQMEKKRVGNSKKPEGETESESVGTTYPPPAATPRTSQDGQGEEGQGKTEAGEGAADKPSLQEDEGEAAEPQAVKADTGLSVRFDRAHRRILRLNPVACIDYVIPKAPQSYLMPVPSSMLEYVGMLQAHATYWTNDSFVDFLIATSGIESANDARWEKVRETLYGKGYEKRWERQYLEG